MWELLRSAVLHYLRADTAEQFTLQKRRWARDNLIEHGRRLQGPPQTDQEHDPVLVSTPLAYAPPDLPEHMPELQ